jgi:hypothetical protein
MNESEKQFALIDIALVKSYTYCEEYNPTSGQAQMREGHLYLKQGFVDGFLAGVAFRLNGGMNE